MDGEDSFRDDESIRDDDASLAADDDEGSEAVADEASEVGGSAFSDEEPQSGGGDEGAAEGLAPVDYTGVKLKLIGVTRPGEQPILDGAWAAAEAVRQEGERKRAEAAAQAKAASEAKAAAEREQRRAELGEAAEYNPVKPKAERAIPPKQFWATVDELLARPPTSAAVGPPPLPPPPARCPLVDRLIAALLPGGVHGGAGGAAAAAVCGADAATLERTERRLRGSLHELGLLPARESLPPQLRPDPVGCELRSLARSLHTLTCENASRVSALRLHAQAAAAEEQGLRLAAAAASRTRRRYARIRKQQRSKKGGGHGAPKPG